MKEEAESGIKLPVSILVSLIAGSFGVGSAGAGYLSASDNATRAIEVAVQHGKEIDRVRSSLADLRASVIERTQERYKSSDHAKYAANEAQIHLTLERRISALERQVDKLAQ